jgi:hypothetical protein
VTDYYAALPSGTDSGWAHLTTHFQNTIAKSRGSYQSFWDGMESVSLSNVVGTAPGTVTATVTYHLKNGQRSVEDTTWHLVQSNGILKIDSQQ